MIPSNDPTSAAGTANSSGPAPRRSRAKSLFMALLGLFCALYLANPGMGFVEFIQDNIPGAGNLDEAMATLLLLRVFAYFGLNLTGHMPRSQPESRKGRVVR